MESKHVQELVGGLKNHSGIVAFNQERVIGALENMNINESSRFYEPTNLNAEIVNEGDRYHYFWITRILRNKNAFGYSINLGKKGLNVLTKELGIRSTTHLSRKLRLEPLLVDAMVHAYESEHPFSLLGRLDTYELSKKEAIYKIRKPILVIPGIKDMRVITDWEDAETVYEKEAVHWLMPLIRTTKTISKAKYLAALD